MSPGREALTPATLQRLTVVAQISLHLMQVTTTLSESSVVWAKQMFWLVAPGIGADGGAFTAALSDRVNVIDGLQNRAFGVLRDLQDQLTVMLDVATTRGEVPGHLLVQLRATLAGAPTQAREQQVVDLVEARYKRLPVNQALSEIAQGVLETCNEVQRLNTEMAAGMRALPELQRA